MTLLAGHTPRVTLLAGNTPVGHALIHSICNGGHRWKVRALVESPSDERDFTNVFAEEVASSAIETLIWQLLPDSELSQSFSTVSALFVLSESAAGAGGVKTAEFGTLAQTIRKMAAPLKRIVMLSSHGVERTDRLPYSMLNLWGGKLAKLRDAEQELMPGLVLKRTHPNRPAAICMANIAAARMKRDAGDAAKTGHRKAGRLGHQDAGGGWRAHV